MVFKSSVGHPWPIRCRVNLSLAHKCKLRGNPGGSRCASSFRLTWPLARSTQHTIDFTIRRNVMPLKTKCERCGQGVVGLFSSLKRINGKYLCSRCATNPKGLPKYYCNTCRNYTPTALNKGSGWIEFVLYLLYIFPGIIYSVWRRAGSPNVCPLCRAAALVPAAVAKLEGTPVSAEIRDEVECPYCAEKILARAKICKHCGSQVRS